MITSGLTILNADGLHEDGWCWPSVRMHTKLESDLNELRIGIWLKPEDEAPEMVAFTLSLGGGRPLTRYVRFGEPTELAFIHKFRAGTEVSLELNCDHQVLDAGDDQRDLSFILMSVVAM